MKLLKEVKKFLSIFLNALTDDLFGKVSTFVLLTLDSLISKL